MFRTESPQPYTLGLYIPRYPQCREFTHAAHTHTKAKHTWPDFPCEALQLAVGLNRPRQLVETCGWRWCWSWWPLRLSRCPNRWACGSGQIISFDNIWHELIQFFLDWSNKWQATKAKQFFCFFWTLYMTHIMLRWPTPSWVAHDSASAFQRPQVVAAAQVATGSSTHDAELNWVLWGELSN